MSFLKANKTRIFLIIIIGTLIFAGQKLMGQSATTDTQVQKSEAKVERGTITSGIFASGIVETANYLPITTSVNGIVKQVYVKEGDAVVKGQKIMEITLNSDGEESLAQAWGSYLSAKNSLDRAYTELRLKETALINAEEDFDTEKEQNSYQTHYERNSYKISENAYLSAKDGYDQQLSSIEQAKISLNKAWLAYQAQSSTIVAPDRGTVANILVVEGMDISNSLSERTSTSVASIKKEGNPIISLNITEMDINNIEVGQKAVLELNSIDNMQFTGKVVGIDKIGSVSGGVTNYTVIVRFDEPSEDVLPNMGVDGTIILEEKQNVLTIPSAAITSNRQQKTVTVLKDGQESVVKIETGITDGAYTEVVSGLNEGDIILVNSLPTSGYNEATQQNQRDNFRPGMFIR